MIKVFECLGVQTFEKDGKKGIKIPRLFMAQS